MDISFYCSVRGGIDIHIEYNECQKLLGINWCSFGENSLENTLSFTTDLIYASNLANKIYSLLVEDKFIPYLLSNSFKYNHEVYDVIELLEPDKLKILNMSTRVTSVINIGDFFNNYKLI